MQRTEEGMVIISCDFCGTDWDEVIPMIEGHHGSVLCLDCLKKALAEKTPAVVEVACTLCLQRHEPGTIVWTPTDRPAAANQKALACDGCIKQAAGTYSKDKDIDWKWDRSK